MAIVYQWTDTLTGMKYIGCRKGDLEGYVCSSKVMLPIYNERPDTFVREVLIECDTFEEALTYEKKMLTEVDAARNPMYYNRHNGGGCNFRISGPMSNTHIEKIVKARKGKYKPIFTEEWKRKIGDANRGRSLTIEHRNKIGNAHRNKIVSLTTRKKLSESKKNCVITEIARLKISNSLKGRILSPDHKNKLSIALKGKKRPPFSDEWKQKLGNGCRGKCWYFHPDTLIEKKFIPGTETFGFLKGRKK